MLTSFQLESKYRAVSVVQNICVYADPNKNKPIAIVVPVEATLKQLASQNGIKGEHLEQLVHDEKLTSIVLKQIQDAGRRSGLGGIEIVDGLVLVPDEWTPQNVCMLPFCSCLNDTLTLWNRT